MVPVAAVRALPSLSVPFPFGIFHSSFSYFLIFLFPLFSINYQSQHESTITHILNHTFTITYLQSHIHNYISTNLIQQIHQKSQEYIKNEFVLR
jgi:hypothetical protein